MGERPSALALRGSAAGFHDRDAIIDSCGIHGRNSGADEPDRILRQALLVLLNQQSFDVRTMQLRNLHLAEHGRNMKAEETGIASQRPRLEPACGFPKPALAVLGDGHAAKLGQRQPFALLPPFLREKLVFEFSRFLFGRAEIAMAHAGGVVKIDHPSSSFFPVPG